MPRITYQFRLGKACEVLWNPTCPCYLYLLNFWLCFTTHFKPILLIQKHNPSLRHHLLPVLTPLLSHVSLKISELPQHYTRHPFSSHKGWTNSSKPKTQPIAETSSATRLDTTTIPCISKNLWITPTLHQAPILIHNTHA